MSYTPGTWWAAPAGRERFIAYYHCMRVCYGMPAHEALATARKNWGVVGNLIEDLRTALHTAV